MFPFPRHATRTRPGLQLGPTRALLAVISVVLMIRVTRGDPVAPGSAGRWIVVTAPAFKDAIEPLKQRRAAEGFDVTVVTTTDVLTPDEIRRNAGGRLADRVRELWKSSPATSYVLLVGMPAGSGDQTAQTTRVPCLFGTVGRMKGLPTDQPFGCLAGEIKAKVPVGRWPARTADEVKTLVAKTIAYENDGQHRAAWRRSIAMLVGSPGGSTPSEIAMGNRFINNSTRSAAQAVSPLLQIHAVCHVATSQWNVPDAMLHDQSMAVLREGEAFTLHMGHSSPDGFWSDGARFVDRADWQTLNMPHGAGVLVTCGCFACQYDPAGREDHEGFGLTAVRSPGGPVAVIGATAESYSVAGLTAFNGLLPCFTGDRFPERLGEAWMDIQHGIAAGPVDYLTAKMLDYGDGSSGRIPLEIQRQEHQQMWTLLGDPALRLPEVAAEISLHVPAAVKATERLSVQGQLPEGSHVDHVRIQLERSAGSLPTDLAAVPDQRGGGRDAVVLGNFYKAQNLMLATEVVPVHEGKFTIELDVSKGLPGSALGVRVIAGEGNDRAMGAVRVTIKK
jgi:hypothetical protein